MLFLLACGGSQSAVDSAEQYVFSPRTESLEVELEVGRAKVAV